MNYEEAIELMKRGGTLTRNGKTYKLGRGVQDVTDPEKPVHVYMSDDDRTATDWEAAPAAAPSEAADEPG